MTRTDPLADSETRYQRIAREQAERQAKREVARKVVSRSQLRRDIASRRTADRIDGYDRDDLGLSPDY